MDNDIKGRGEGVKIQSMLCDRQITSELSSDFSLPDYQPEIKRLLRVRANLLPAEKFIGAGSAEISGTVEYDILYAGNDGALYSAEERSEYRFSVPLELPSDFEIGDGILCDAESVPDAVTGRVAAPRRLSLRCRLRSRVRMYGTKTFPEEIRGAEEKDLQRLLGSAVCVRRFSGRGEPLPLGDEIPLDAQEGNLRVIGAESAVFVSGAEAGSDCVNCRGEVYLKLLCCRDGSGDLPFAQTRKIPFSQTVTVDGATVNCDAVADGVCTDLKVTVEEGKILCEAEVVLDAKAHRNEEFSYTRDVYSLTSDGKTEFTEAILPCALRCVVGNFSLNETFPLSDVGIKPGLSAVDAVLTPISVSAESERGKTVLSGRCRAHVILSGDGDMSAQEFEVPFRYEADGAADAFSGCDAEVIPALCRARVDGDKILVDAELCVSASLFGESRVGILSSAEFSAPADARPASVCVVCYPDRSDTLWSVAKRYHRPVSALSDANALPSSASADSPESLSGSRFLLV